MSNVYFGKTKFYSSGINQIHRFFKFTDFYLLSIACEQRESSVLNFSIKIIRAV